MRADGRHQTCVTHAMERGDTRMAGFIFIETGVPHLVVVSNGVPRCEIHETAQTGG